MKAAIYRGAKNITIEEVAEPSLQSGTVKVKVQFAGICGSDMHEYFGGPYDFRTSEYFGHEFAGEITEVAEGVTDLKVGDHVAVEPLLSCGECDNCRRGLPNICLNKAGYGYTDHGGFGEYVVAKAEKAHLLPEDMPVRLGALVEPASVAVHAVRQSQMKIGDDVVVLGAGPIGLFLIESVIAAGASRVFVVETSAERLAKAKEIGANFCINPIEEDAVKFIHTHTNGGVDVAFEAAGVEATFNTGIQAIKSAGQMIVVSIWEKPASFVPNNMVALEKNIKGSFGYRNNFPAVIQLLASGRLDGDKIITKEISLDNLVPEGFETLAQDKSQAKIVVDLSK